MVETAEVARGTAGDDDVAAAPFTQLTDHDAAHKPCPPGNDNTPPMKHAGAAIASVDRPHSPPRADIRRSSWPLNLSSSSCTSASTIILTRSRNLMQGVQPRRSRAREAP